MESRADINYRHALESADMLARHNRELAELDNRWWSVLFTDDPATSYANSSMTIRGWIEHELPTIIRKREMIGVTVSARVISADGAFIIWPNYNTCEITIELANKLAGRTLAPGERVEI